MKKLLPSILTVGLMVLMIQLTTSSQPTYAPVHADMTQSHNDMEHAVFQVAKVFGRGGCGDYQLAQRVARISLQNHVDPSLEASVITVESSCNSLAISSKGAVGLGQVLVSFWKKSVDFSKVNLFNPDDNLDQSTKILHDMIQTYGTRKGLLQYSGGDPAYVDKVMTLAGVK